MTSTPLRDFLEIPYEKLEEMNLEVKQARGSRAPRRRSPRRATQRSHRAGLPKQTLQPG